MFYAIGILNKVDQNITELSKLARCCELTFVRRDIRTEPIVRLLALGDNDNWQRPITRRPG